MANKIEMSLDEIIKSNKTGRGCAGRNRERSQRGIKRRNSQQAGRNAQRDRKRGGITRSYTRGHINSTWKTGPFETSGPHKPTTIQSINYFNMDVTKLLISNLHTKVSDSDIRELFAEFGPLKTSSVHYDMAGRSLGTADVIFEKRNDAIRAIKQYNGVPLDGRVMSIQLITSDIPDVITTLGNKRNRIPQNISKKSTKTQSNGNFTKGKRNSKGGKAGPNRGRGGGKTRNPRRQLTVKELDAQLEAYMKTNSIQSS